MPTDLKKAIYDSLTMGKEGIKSAFMPNRLGGPDAESALKSALFGGLGASSVPIAAMDEAALGVGNVIAEDTGRAAAAVERAGYPSMAKGLAGGGVALGMAPFIGGMALDPEMGAAKAAGASVLERLAASNLPEAVLRKAESIQALHGEKALADLVQEYADRGVPLFSHDLPMDEASRMARAKEIGFAPKDWYHGTKNEGFLQFDPSLSDSNTGSGVYPDAMVSTNKPGVANTYAGQKDVAGTIADVYPPQSNVIPLKIRNEKPLRVNALGSSWRDIPYPTSRDSVTTNDLMEMAAQKNKSGLLVNRVFDTQNGAPIESGLNVVFDPSRLRSPYAAFDPRMKDSKFLLALKAGAIPLAGISAFSQGEQ